MSKLEKMIDRMKMEIREHIAAGIVPESVASFSALHDYVDANEYGGLCEGGAADWDALVELGNAAQNAVNDWLAAGRPN